MVEKGGGGGGEKKGRYYYIYIDNNRLSSYDNTRRRQSRETSRTPCRKTCLATTDSKTVDLKAATIESKGPQLFSLLWAHRTIQPLRKKWS